MSSLRLIVILFACIVSIYAAALPTNGTVELESRLTGGWHTTGRVRYVSPTLKTCCTDIPFTDYLLYDWTGRMRQKR